ncbi:MAG: hypothetical protein RR033_02700 [Clostridia bacterium]
MDFCGKIKQVDGICYLDEPSLTEGDVVASKLANRSDLFKTVCTPFKTVKLGIFNEAKFNVNRQLIVACKSSDKCLFLLRNNDLRNNGIEAEVFIYRHILAYVKNRIKCKYKVAKRALFKVFAIARVESEFLENLSLT